ncbi:MAG: hypothetical protein ACYDCH_03410 [Gaiellaceae bacterium]
MTPTPNFDELVGTDVESAERDRLRRVHELLVTAGPPAELSPEIERGPTLAMTLGGRPARAVKRRVMLMAAAIMVVALAFLGGYLAGNGSVGSLATARTLRLVGTAAAPGALASLQIEPADAAGNWPMRLNVEGLPKLPAYAHYEVYVTRNGKPWAPCGTFVVAGVNHGTVVTLNAPYRLRTGDSWVVTIQRPDQRDPGTVVLKPTL